MIVTFGFTRVYTPLLSIFQEVCHNVGYFTDSLDRFGLVLLLFIVPLIRSCLLNTLKGVQYLNSTVTCVHHTDLTLQTYLFIKLNDLTEDVSYLVNPVDVNLEVEIQTKVPHLFGYSPRGPRTTLLESCIWSVLCRDVTAWSSDPFPSPCRSDPF